MAKVYIDKDTGRKLVKGPDGKWTLETTPEENPKGQKGLKTTGPNTGAGGGNNTNISETDPYGKFGQAYTEEEWEELVKQWDEEKVKAGRTPETAEEIQHRMDDIENLLVADADDVIAQETQNKYQRDLAARKQRAEQEARRRRREEAKKWYEVKNLSGFENFKNEFLSAIKIQVEQYKDELDTENTYSAWNRRNTVYHNRYKGSGKSVILQGERELDPEIPSIDVFIDVSGSFSNSDVTRCLKVLQLLERYEEEGLLLINVFWVSTGCKQGTGLMDSNGHINDSAYTFMRHRGWNEGSFSGYADGDGNITGGMYDAVEGQYPKPKNILIMTDDNIDDVHDKDGNNLSISVPGCAWFIWKESKSRPLFDAIHAARGKFEYSL